MCAIPLPFRFSLDLFVFQFILVLSREGCAQKGNTYMKKLITIILALIMTFYTAPQKGADQPSLNAPCAPTEPHPEPVPRKIRKSGTGCLYQINDNLWEGSFFPRLPGGKRKKFNVYAETKEQCEIKLTEMIERVKAEIAEEKEKGQL